MNKSELINIVAAEAKISKKSARSVLHSMTDLCIREVSAGRPFNWPGLGKFQVTDPEAPKHGRQRVFEFRAGHTRKPTAPGRRKGLMKGDEVNYEENMMLNDCYEQLASLHGKDNVGTELSTGLDSRIDLAIRLKDGSFVFYEFKTCKSAKEAIREALAQLLEYAYYPDDCRASKLIVASPQKIDEHSRTYLESLRNKFNLPVFYQRYDRKLKGLQDQEF